MQGSGNTNAFNCMEINTVLSEVQRVNEWKQRAANVVGVKVGDNNLLLDGLSQVQHTTLTFIKLSLSNIQDNLFCRY